MSKSDDFVPYVDPPGRTKPETPSQKHVRREGKRARDELDKAVKDPNRLGNKGRGSR